MIRNYRVDGGRTFRLDTMSGLKSYDMHFADVEAELYVAFDEPASDR